LLYLSPMNHYLLLLIGFLFFAACQSPSSEKSATGHAQAFIEAQPEPELLELGKAYEDWFSELFEASNVPGAGLTILKDGFPIVLKGFGKRTAGLSKPVNIHTKFRLGSVSKTFAALTTAKVVEAGKVEWTTPIKKWVPEFAMTPAAQSSRVQLQHILSHTSGLSPHAYTNLLEAGKSIKEIAPHFVDVKETKTEGDNFAYQNAAYALVEPFLENVTGKKYSELLEEYIFEPAKMENASTDLETIKSSTNKASPHSAVGKKGRYKKIRWNKKYYNAVSAGGVNASILDMSQYLKLVLGHRQNLFPDSLLQKVFTPRIETNFERRYFDKWRGTHSAHYAMGWRVINYEDRQLVYHGGYVNGFRAEIVLDPKENIGACLLLNASNPLANNFVPQFFAFYDKWQKEHAPTEELAPQPLSQK